MIHSDVPVCFSSPFCVQWCHVGSLNLATVGVFTLRQLAKGSSFQRAGCETFTDMSLLEGKREDPEWVSFGVGTVGVRSHWRWQWRCWRRAKLRWSSVSEVMVDWVPEPEYCEGLLSTDRAEFPFTCVWKYHDLLSHTLKETGPPLCLLPFIELTLEHLRVFSKLPRCHLSESDL